MLYGMSHQMDVKNIVLRERPIEVPTYSEASVTSIDARTALSRSAVELRDNPDRLTRRGLDILISAIALIWISPLILMLAILIRLISRGPAFYNQQREGLHGTYFKMWKIRT